MFHLLSLSIHCNIQILASNSFKIFNFDYTSLATLHYSIPIHHSNTFQYMNSNYRTTLHIMHPTYTPHCNYGHKCTGPPIDQHRSHGSSHDHRTYGTWCGGSTLNIYSTSLATFEQACQDPQELLDFKFIFYPFMTTNTYVEYLVIKIQSTSLAARKKACQNQQLGKHFKHFICFCLVYPFITIFKFFIQTVSIY